MWNASVNVFLVKNVYLRLPSFGFLEKWKMVDAYRTLGTFMISALWHGFYPTYFMTFFLTFVCVMWSRNLYRYTSAHKTLHNHPIYRLCLLFYFFFLFFITLLASSLQFTSTSSPSFSNFYNGNTVLSFYMGSTLLLLFVLFWL